MAVLGTKLNINVTELHFLRKYLREHSLMKLNTIVIARAFSEKVGVDRLRIVVTEGAFYNI
jgi:hypothetical protein